MVKLSEIDVGAKDLMVFMLGALTGYYIRKPIEDRKKAEKESDAQLVGKITAQYVANELKTLGMTPEIYRVLDELSYTLKELKEKLERG